jgi:hypothetical protein
LILGVVIDANTVKGSKCTEPAEPCGISAAEMVKAGAIFFAPNAGGQIEVLNRIDLLFASVEDAEDKICGVESNPDKADAMRIYLSQRAQDFSALGFKEKSIAAIASANAVCRLRGLNSEDAFHEEVIWLH